MILYTVLDVESCLRDQSEEPPRFEEALVNDVPVLIKWAGDNEARIHRVLSSDPNDFLKPDLSPGTQVVFTD